MRFSLLKPRGVAAADAASFAFDIWTVLRQVGRQPSWSEATVSQSVPSIHLSHVPQRHRLSKGRTEIAVLRQHAVGCREHQTESSSKARHSIE